MGVPRSAVIHRASGSIAAASSATVRVRIGVAGTRAG